jgi:hypothetical protein
VLVSVEKLGAASRYRVRPVTGVTGVVTDSPSDSPIVAKLRSGRLGADRRSGVRLEPLTDRYQMHRMAHFHAIWASASAMSAVPPRELVDRFAAETRLELTDSAPTPTPTGVR